MPKMKPDSSCQGILDSNFFEEDEGNYRAFLGSSSREK
jgi:hypothetical protein